jgi:hypothetical protein
LPAAASTSDKHPQAKHHHHHRTTYVMAHDRLLHPKSDQGVSECGEAVTWQKR